MSHVDEGTLHAFLDGELPSSERATVEAHLAQCATCRATLAEERALLERASAVLGSARPVERPAPTFEQLRRSSKRSSWHVRTPVAWAASIMLALGLGYYLRDPGTDVAPVAAPFRHDGPPASISEDRAAPSAQEEKVAAAPRDRFQARRVIPSTDEVTRATGRARTDSAAGLEAASGVVAIVPPAQLRNAAPTPAAAAPSMKDSLALGEAIVVSGAHARAAAVQRDVLTTKWQIINRGTARTLLGTDPVGLPGLATRRIRRSPAQDATVVVEQALDSSTVIQFFQRPADRSFSFVDGAPLRRAERDRAAREAAPAAAPAPADRLARYVGRLRVEISGPLTPDSLNKLLEQVEPLP